MQHFVVRSGFAPDLALSEHCNPVEDGKPRPPLIRPKILPLFFTLSASLLWANSGPTAFANNVQLAEGFESPDTIFSYSSTRSIPYDIQNSEAAHTGEFSFKSYTSTCGASCHDEYRVDLLHTFPESVRLVGVEFWVKEDSTTGRAWGGKISVGHDDTWNLWWWQAIDNRAPITGEWQHLFVPIDELATNVRIRIVDISSVSTMWLDDIVIHLQSGIVPSPPGAILLQEPLSHQLGTVLGVPPLSWSIVGGALPPGMTLSADGVFSGTPEELGSFTFSIRVADSNGETVEETFTVEVVLVLPPPDIRLYKTGTTPVPGRIVDYFIVVHNVGDVTARDIEVGEPLNLRQVSLISVLPPAVADIPTLSGAAFIIWLVPELAPGEVIVLSYQVELSASVPIGSIVAGGPACTGTQLADAWGQCLEQAFLTTAGCALCASTCELLASTCGWSCTIPTVPTLIGCLGCVAPCVNCLFLGIETGGEGGCVQDVGGVIDCFANLHDNCVRHDEPATGPVDPNEKLVLADRFIQPDETLVYPIHFENIGEVEAIDVFVTDVLDANLDASTLELLTSAGGSFDPATRTVRWDLLGMNLQPGETGNVLLSIRPLPELASGTGIRNSAEIQFEVFEPIITDEVVNIIDSTPPSCTMDPLAVEIATLDFEISWSGTDAIGEIESYSIFLSAGGVVFEPFLEETSDTNATFTGVPNTTYGFFCVAKDTVGNVEQQTPAAETTTTVVLEGPRGSQPRGMCGACGAGAPAAIGMTLCVFGFLRLQRRRPG